LPRRCAPRNDEGENSTQCLNAFHDIFNTVSWKLKTTDKLPRQSEARRPAAIQQAAWIATAPRAAQ
jgi:hypothetical protein